MPRLIEVVPHSKTWETEYQVEARAIRQALGDAVVRVHHIGSTAIPGIFAKPIIDILLEVVTAEVLDSEVAVMESLGYVAKGEYGIPGRRYFRKNNDSDVRTHQVHAFEAGSDQVERHLAFRDFMIAYPEIAATYSDLKRKSAKQHPHDIQSYMDAKDPFIKEYEARALAWRGENCGVAQRDILYRGMIVEYWDLLRGDTSKWSSRPYFLEIIHQSGQPVLDVACGTGRLLLDYASEGIDIDGVDISQEMISLARMNAEGLDLKPDLFTQSMQALDLPRKYKTIIVPSSSFLHLTDLADAQRALQRFLVHLEPGGRLAMSMRLLNPEPVQVDWEIDSQAIRPSDGLLIRRWFRCSYDVENRIQHTEDRYQLIKECLVIQEESYQSSPFLTWYALADALALLRDAGFSEVEAHSDFTFHPATENDTNYIVLGRKPISA